MESLNRTLCIVLLLHGGLLLTPTSAAYPQVLDVQIVAHNHTDLSAVPLWKKKINDCDAICEALKSLEPQESDIIRLSSLTVHTDSLWNVDWPLMALYKIIFTVMQLKYLRQPVLM
uniref:Minor capsid protein L2 n=1 Tax=Zeugodacus cucurbitae TaxID=28588 RepID=A0A0A1WMS7_ZEUCU